MSLSAIFEDEEKRDYAAARQSKWEKLNAKAQLKWGQDWNKEKDEYRSSRADTGTVHKKKHP